MATDYLDQLAALLTETGIAPTLRKKSPGVRVGSIDTSRMWDHDETPQFINFKSSGQSEKKIFAGTSHDCSKLSKENRESITIQPFSNFTDEMVQVIFSGAGLTSRMCPPLAAEKIPNLLISVNDSDCTTGGGGEPRVANSAFPPGFREL